MRQVHRGHTPHDPYDQCPVQADSLRGREGGGEGEREEEGKRGGKGGVKGGGKGEEERERVGGRE